MTDDFHGVPEGTQCAYSFAQNAGKADVSLPSCDAVYHSCAPVTINGTVPRADHTCSYDEHARQMAWPFVEGKPPSTYLFKGDPGLYHKETSQLESGGAPIAGCSQPSYCDPARYYTKTVDVPADAKYTRAHGSCAAVAGMKVEPFQLGQLPSQPIVQGSAASSASDSGGSPNSSAEASGRCGCGSGKMGILLALLVALATVWGELI